MDQTLTGRTALVTGGTRGLGAATVRTLAGRVLDRFGALDIRAVSAVSQSLLTPTAPATSRRSCPLARLAPRLVRESGLTTPAGGC
jgi:hypothetical protein